MLAALTLRTRWRTRWRALWRARCTRQLLRLGLRVLGGRLDAAQLARRRPADLAGGGVAGAGAAVDAQVEEFAIVAAAAVAFVAALAVDAALGVLELERAALVRVVEEVLEALRRSEAGQTARQGGPQTEGKEGGRERMATYAGFRQGRPLFLAALASMVRLA